MHLTIVMKRDIQRHINKGIDLQMQYCWEGWKDHGLQQAAGLGLFLSLGCS